MARTWLVAAAVVGRVVSVRGDAVALLVPVQPARHPHVSAGSALTEGREDRWGWGRGQGRGLYHSRWVGVIAGMVESTSRAALCTLSQISASRLALGKSSSAA